MVKNIFISSLRSLVNNKNALLLNIFGLSIGIAACILAYAHVSYELSYDNNYKKQDQLFRLVVGNMETGEGWVKVSAPIPDKLKNEIPEIEKYARVTEYSYNDKDAVKVGDRVFSEAGVFLADLELLSLMDIELYSGSIPNQVAGNEVFISTTIAQKIFKNQEALNKILTINGSHQYKVAGVFNTIPDNSHFAADYIIPFTQLETVLPGTSLTGNWGQFNYFAYLQLEKSADIQEVIFKIKASTVEFGNDQEMKFEQLTLQPLQDIHFQGSPGNIKASYDKKYLFIYAAIALAIFLVSVINFLNLSIATSTNRIKEVGIRKVMGAPRSQIIFQFMSEGLILSCFAVLLALALSKTTEPIINNLINSSSDLTILDPMIGLILVGLILFVSVFSGLYVSFFIISFKPVNALRGGIKLGQKDAKFKNGLLITQFVMSSVLILSSILIYQQLDYLKNSNLGLRKDQLLTLKIFDTSSQEKINTLATEIKQIPGVELVAASRFTPGTANWNQTVTWSGQAEEVTWNIIEAGPGFADVYDLELTQGNAELIRNISGEQLTYLVNEEAVKQANWETAIGKPISAFGKNGNAPIAGVVKNFHFRSLHNSIDPLVIVVRESTKNNLLTLKFDGAEPQQLLTNLEAKYHQVYASSPFEYRFVNQQFEELYAVEDQSSKLVGLLSGIAILLSVLGTYALLSFTLKERSKEIAIRKVLGNHLKGTIFLLSKRYLYLLLVANMIGVGTTFYLISGWLENFSYHITPGILPIAIGIITSFSTILLVILSKALQAEKINPATVLKDD